MKKIRPFYLYACLCFCLFPLLPVQEEKWQYEWDGAEQCHFLGGF